MEYFNKKDMKPLFRPGENSNGEDNGQVTILGGSSLFHGAPLLSLTAASRIVDMVFFSSPEETMKDVSAYLKSSLGSFIWVPWEEVEDYIEKSDAVLIGPGFMRFKSEKTPHGERLHICDEVCMITKSTTESLLSKFKHKKWVIDAGSLQTMDPSFIPEGAILTPNTKEFRFLFGVELSEDPEQRAKLIQESAKKHKCTIVVKGPETIVADSENVLFVKGGNPGLTKGGTGDVQAGITAALYAKNNAFLSACAASYLIKKTAESLAEDVDIYFNADDVAEKAPRVLQSLLWSQK